jgi:hypothetical protein
MKSTSFEFGLRITEGLMERPESNLKNELLRLNGVKEVTYEGALPSLTMHVQAEFADGNAAKRLHRKIMTKLMATEGVEVAHVKTNLTEVFG